MSMIENVNNFRVKTIILLDCEILVFSINKGLKENKLKIQMQCFYILTHFVYTGLSSLYELQGHKRNNQCTSNIYFLFIYIFIVKTFFADRSLSGRRFELN